MKLNRLMGMLMALALLLGASVASAESAELPPLYVVLADCGWTLYGDGTPGKNSVVSEVGDPEGLTLSFVEGALPKLVEQNAQIMVFGYNDKLHYAPNSTPVSASDAEGIGAQVNELRTLSGRQSSRLDSALKELADKLQSYTAQFDVRLMIFSGGAVNSASAMESDPLPEVAAALAQIRAMGVQIDSYVWELGEQEGSILTEQVMGEGCSMISGNGIVDRIAGLCDSVLGDLCDMAYNGNGSLKNADPATLQSCDAAVVLTAEKTFEVYIGENLSALTERQATAVDGDTVRLYRQFSRIDALVSRLDANGDGALDKVLEVGGESVQFSEIDLEGIQLAAEPAFSVTADAVTGTLTFTANQSGTSKLVITAADGATTRELSVTAVDYTVTWNQENDSVLYVGETANIASCTDLSNVLQGELWLNGKSVTDAQLGSSLQYAPAEVGQLHVSLSINDRPAEERDFSVQYRLGEGQENQSLTLTYPNYGTQKDQSVQVLDAQGNAIPLESFEVSDSALADVYFNEAGDGLFIQPKGSGAAVITLTHAQSGQTISLNLTVNSLFASGLFWLTAAGVPICLIGLTAMTVLLIVKLRGKRR